jgi:hypothetical protein
MTIKEGIGIASRQTACRIVVQHIMLMHHNSIPHRIMNVMLMTISRGQSENFTINIVMGKIIIRELRQTISRKALALR